MRQFGKKKTSPRRRGKTPTPRKKPSTVESRAMAERQALTKMVYAYKEAAHALKNAHPVKKEIKKNLVYKAYENNANDALEKAKKNMKIVNKYRRINGQKIITIEELFHLFKG